MFGEKIVGGAGDITEFLSVTPVCRWFFVPFFVLSSVNIKTSDRQIAISGAVVARINGIQRNGNYGGLL
jgi:hypothetical protein